jgi:peptide/nickel transport system ATP-binding protein
LDSARLLRTIKSGLSIAGFPNGGSPLLRRAPTCLRAAAHEAYNREMLTVRGLTVELAGRPIVADVSFDAGAGQIVGLFGESGCGKTTLALALLGLLPPAYRVRGSVKLRGEELLGRPERALERLRGAAVSLIFQDPMLALNPVMRIGHQIREVGRAHGVPAKAPALPLS